MCIKFPKSIKKQLEEVKKELEIVKKELNKKLDKEGGSMTGTITTSHEGIKTPDRRGYITDELGNFVHTNVNWEDYFSFRDKNNNATCKIHYENGDIITDGNITAKGKFPLGELFVDHLFNTIDTKTSNSYFFKFGNVCFVVIHVLIEPKAVGILKIIDDLPKCAETSYGFFTNTDNQTFRLKIEKDTNTILTEDDKVPPGKWYNGSFIFLWK